jgi:hypothetical protein
MHEINYVPVFLVRLGRRSGTPALRPESHYEKPILRSGVTTPVFLTRQQIALCDPIT